MNKQNQAGASGGSHDRGPTKATAAMATVRDPVCGMTVDPAAAKGGSAAHEGTTYHFCSAGCHHKFVASPQQYLDRVPAAASAPPSHLVADAASSRAMYTCPMHPQIRQQGPGTCPLCGERWLPLPDFLSLPKISSKAD